MAHSLSASPIFAMSGILISILGAAFAVRGQETGETGGPTPAADEGDDFSQLYLGGILEAPTVQSASRREQSLDEAPAAITVITGEEIVASGVTNLAEVLRRVPGAFVVQTNANNFHVGLRGAQRIDSSRLLVLQDGRSVLNWINLTVPWPGLASSPLDVERIEVIRGPGSITYGTNALTGVINIITKRPIDHPGFQALGWGQMGYLSDQGQGKGGPAWMRNGGGGALAYGWANQAENLGIRVGCQLNQDPEWPSQALPYEHGPFQYSLRAAVESRPSKDLTVFATASHNQSEVVNIIEIASVVHPRLQNIQAFSLSVEKQHFLREHLALNLQLDGQHIAASYAPKINLGGQDFTRFTVSSTETYDLHGMALANLTLFDNRDTLTFGAELTGYLMEHYYSSKPQVVFASAVIQNDATFLSDSSLVLSTGVRLEQIHAKDDNLGQATYRHFTPRLSLIWQFAGVHSLRLTGTSSFRVPTPMEAFTDVNTGDSMNDPPIPPYQLLIGNPYLKPEDLASLELGYRGVWLKSFRVDASAFAQKIENLIGPTRQTLMPTTWKNISSVDQFGLELGLVFQAANWLSGYFNYSFTYSLDAKKQTQLKDWPMHLYGLGGELRLPHHSRLNVDSYFVFASRPTVSRIQNPDSHFTLIGYESRQSPDQAWVNLRYGIFPSTDRVELFLMLKNLVGFFRDPDELRMYPVPESVESIGGTVMIGLVMNQP